MPSSLESTRSFRQGGQVSSPKLGNGGQSCVILTKLCRGASTMAKFSRLTPAKHPQGFIDISFVMYKFCSYDSTYINSDI